MIWVSLLDLSSLLKTSPVSSCRIYINSLSSLHIASHSMFNRSCFVIYVKGYYLVGIEESADARRSSYGELWRYRLWI